MSILLRAARPASRAVTRSTIQSRGVHIDNTVYNNMPFQYRNKKAFAFKLGAFLSFGFSIPFIASAYQMSKSAKAS